MQYAPTKTPLPMSEIVKAFEAYAKAGQITRDAVPILAALVAVENAHGGAIYGHNWGNITTADPAADHFMFEGNERKFMQFADHITGLYALLERLGSRTHKRMLDAANRGDVEGFVRGMTTPHPETKMMYCDTCEPSATLKTYKAVVKKLGGSRRKGRAGGELLFGIAIAFASSVLMAWKVTRR